MAAEVGSCGKACRFRWVVKALGGQNQVGVEELWREGRSSGKAIVPFSIAEVRAPGNPELGKSGANTDPSRAATWAERVALSLARWPTC
jgi:hypothetical protein